MANTILRFTGPSGATLTLELYPSGSDTIGNTGGDTLTEATNAKGFYTATVTEALTGDYRAVVKSGSNIFATGWVLGLADDTNTYDIADTPPTVLADVNAEVDTAISDANLATAASISGLNDLSAAEINAEVDTAIADAALATAASIAALNDISAAEVNAEVDAALADYDPPTNTELTNALAGLNDLNAAGIRAALGMAAADLDTQLDAIPTANENADALLDRADGIETGWPLRKAMRIILAGFGGKLSGANTTTNVIRDVGDTKARITATTDAFGNRSAMTLDGD